MIVDPKKNMLPQLANIIKRRKLLGLTQKQLSRLAGVSQSLIAKLETGKTDPSYSKAKKIFDTVELLEKKSEAHAREIIHKDVVGVQKNAKVLKAVELMADHGFSQLPVFDGEHAVGNISEKTILNQILAGKDLEEISSLPIEEIMEEGFPQVGEDTPLGIVSGLLQIHPAVLVVNKGKVAGIATKADIFKEVLRK